jgi:hypothetical protein
MMSISSFFLLFLAATPLALVSASSRPVQDARLDGSPSPFSLTLESAQVCHNGLDKMLIRSNLMLSITGGEVMLR